MVANAGVLVVREDTYIKGKIKNCRHIDIFGYVEGELTADTVMIHEGGRLFGKVKAGNADVHGTLQGNVTVANLIHIRSSGVVSGNVQYGKLAMEAGGDLSADVRNVPPSIAGDLDLTVYRGRTVGVTVVDLTALAPDDEAGSLTYTVSNTNNGFVSLSHAPAQPVISFTQADLEADKVAFKHDGSAADWASFDVVVTDASGATSGTAQTVKVTVHNRR